MQQYIIKKLQKISLWALAKYSDKHRNPHPAYFFSERTILSRMEVSA